MNFKKFVLKTACVIISMTKIKFEDFYFDNILIDEKSHKNILIYNILYKSFIGAKPLHVRFDKMDGFIRVYDGSRYLVLFGLEKYDAIYNRIRYFISQKSSITYIFSHYYMEIKVDSYHSLPLEKTLALHTILLNIKSVLKVRLSPSKKNCFICFSK